MYPTAGAAGESPRQGGRYWAKTIGYCPESSQAQGVQLSELHRPSGAICRGAGEGMEPPGGDWWGGGQLPRQRSRPQVRLPGQRQQHSGGILRRTGSPISGISGGWGGVVYRPQGKGAGGGAGVHPGAGEAPPGQAGAKGLGTGAGNPPALCRPHQGEK